MRVKVDIFVKLSVISNDTFKSASTLGNGHNMAGNSFNIPTTYHMPHALNICIIIQFLFVVLCSSIEEVA